MHATSLFRLALVVAALAATAFAQDQGPKLIAQTYDSGFAEAHDTYNGMGCGSDGKIYYVISAEKYDVGAKMFSFDPATKTIALLGDLTEICGEAGKKSVVQGKSHVNFSEANGKLYFSTHAGFYSIIDGMEKMGVPPAGWTAYPGGHVLSYDLKTGAFEDFGIAVAGEGVLTMSMDGARGRIYGITWPKGHFFRYDLAKKEFKDFGLFAKLGEAGQGDDYRTLCRSIAVNPDDGAAYFTTGDGDILRYDYATEKITHVEGDNLRKDYFGLYDPRSPGHMGYNWRQTFWSTMDKKVYGVHGNSGYLFRFDPAEERVEVLDRITSEPSQRAGMFDQFSYGYLGYALGPDNKTINYLTGGPIYVEGKRVAGKSETAMGESKGLEDLHLVTYDIESMQYRDHGAIFFENGDRPINVNSIAVGKDATVYFLARITVNGRTWTDLVAVRPN